MDIKSLILAIGLVSLFSLFCFYLDSNRRAVPSKSQRTIAFIWLIIRRVISFTGAFVFALISLLLLTKAPESKNLITNIAGGISFGALSLFAIYVGVFGRKSKFSTPTEDISYHKKRKNHYKWK